ncbi:MAG: TetR/AcrR family transcriptional regulator [Phycisphaerae bacterium]
MARPVRFKTAIYESATKLFGERGLSGTGIREIAREAGVSEAALYRHWKGKRQLAEDIFQAGMGELDRRLRRVAPADGPANQAILAVIRNLYEAYDQNSQAVHYLLLNQHDLWRSMGQSEANPVTFWFDLLRSRAGEFELTPELSSDILGPITLGMVLRPAIAAAYGSIDLPLTQHAEPVAVAICRVLGLPWVTLSDTPAEPAEPQR